MARRFVKPSENRLRMELMFLNEGATGEWTPGSRESGFWSSAARSFSTQSGTVLDHWKGAIDLFSGEQQEIDVPTFQEMVGDRDLPAPSERLTLGQTQRRIDRYDREELQSQYETNFRSAVGAFIGGTPPWLLSPEGLAGFAVPVLRVNTISRASLNNAKQSARRSSSAAATAGSRVGARRPTSARAGAKAGAIGAAPESIMVGSTNLLMQSAAYGEVDALEATLAFGAPVALGAGIGAIIGARAGALERASKTQVRRPPPSADASAVEFETPEALVEELRRTLDLNPEDTAEVLFQKIDDLVAREKLPDDIADALREAFGRTGLSRRTDLTPEIRAVAKQLDDAQKIPIARTADDVKQQVAKLNRQIKNAEARVKRASARLKATEGDADKGFKAASQKLKEENKKLSELRAERTGLTGKSKESRGQTRIREDIDTQVQSNNRVARQRELVEQTRKTLEKARKAVKKAPDEAKARAAQRRVAKLEDKVDAEQLRLDRITKDTTKRLQRRAGVEPEASPINRRVSVQQALRDLAAAVAKTDHPLPTEFVAEFLEAYQLRKPISKEAISKVDVTKPVNYGRVSKSLQDELDADAGMRGLKGQDGYADALAIQARQEEILENCPL